MRVLFATSEVAGLFKLGGLADVSYSLPVALSKQGIHISVVLPYYEKIQIKNVVCVGQMALDFDRRRELLFVFRAVLPGTTVPVYLIRHPMLNAYDGPDSAARFAFFSKAVAQMYLYTQEILGGPYDILHCNDWHTALIPLLVGEVSHRAYRERGTLQSSAAKTILTVHNLLYQGETGINVALKLGFPKGVFHSFETKLGPAVRFLEEGFEYADVVTTVSPTYAREIAKGIHSKRVRTTFLRRGDTMVGILNGIDTTIWDPKTDTHIPRAYDKRSVLDAKLEIKTRLRHSLGLANVDVPLFGFVGRFEPRQKGLDLIANAIKLLPSDTYQLALLGTGNKALVTQFEHLAATHSNISFTHTFDERLARRIYAGSDVMLVPSKFEPCGLTQMIAMRYGTLPLVRKTGGLADSVRDSKTGFVFNRYTRQALVRKMQEVIGQYQNDQPQWRRMVVRVMGEDFSWKTQAGKYIRLYKHVMEHELRFVRA
jgi:starch synthase